MTEIFKRKALLAEAARQGIDGTEEGYVQYDEIRKAYDEDPEFKKTVQELINILGMSDDAYWQKALAGYIESSTIVKLWESHINNIGLQDATYDEQWQIKNQYSDELLNKATIIWMDTELEAIYKQ
jgi:antitoxin component HigA of HigAB toxin-antitoxin module